MNITVGYDYIRADARSKNATTIDYRGPVLNQDGQYYSGFRAQIDRVFSNKDRTRFTLTRTRHFDRAQTEHKFTALSNGEVVVRGPKGGVRFKGNVIEFANWLETKG